MHRHARTFFLVCATLTFAAAAGCGSETTEDTSGTSSSAGGGGDDGKLHPEPDGVRISEDDACERMRGALATKVQQLGCTKTLRACPNFLRAVYTPQCAEFDSGSVEGCVDHWNGIFNCAILDETDCVVTHYPESAPNGCP